MRQGEGPYEWQLPPGFPFSNVPADNPMTAEKVALGRDLFYDKRLSLNQTQSCATCHRQDRAFADPRGPMSLVNVAPAPVLTWANPNMRQLEQQALVPLFGDHPVERSMAGKGDLLRQRLQALPLYRKHSAAAKRGEALFFSERLECFHCHGGFNFTGTVDYPVNGVTEVKSHNTSLYAEYKEPNVGLYEFTQEEPDKGKFQAPTLRNIDLTAEEREHLVQFLLNLTERKLLTNPQLANPWAPPVVTEEPPPKYVVRGEVVRVCAEDDAITAYHEAVPGLMAAMAAPNAMEFLVTDQQFLASLRPGMKFAAGVRRRGGHYLGTNQKGSEEMTRRSWILSGASATLLPWQMKAATATLPKLAYAFDALEPHIDARTMEIHYAKHHQTYVDNLNKSLAGYPQVAAHPVEHLVGDLNMVPEPIRMAVRNNGGGHMNHSLFWQVLGKPKGGPKGKLAAAITKSFGSQTAFEEKLKAAGLGQFGSGWVWVTAKDATTLQIETSPNQDSPWMKGTTPIMGIDVWEHAYYLKYQNRRADYLAAVLQVINWDFVTTRHEELI